MTASYLPPKATIEESCHWLASNTGELWTLPRLLEHGLTPWLWLDYQEGHPELFGNRVEGFSAPVSFAGDLQRLSADCHHVVLTMTCTPDGRLFRLCPGIEFPADRLRFLRDDIQRLAGKFSATAAAPSGAPEVTPDDWKVAARAIADEMHEKDIRAGAYDSITNIAERVAAVMRTKNIHGPRGPLRGNTIAREALQGGKWKRKS
ncbi:MAG: hypothetical protein V5B33_19890 [Candidatus Accumulibacter sp. UW20]|jgi:hypothetical protein